MRKYSLFIGFLVLTLSLQFPFGANAETASQRTCATKAQERMAIRTMKLGRVPRCVIPSSALRSSAATIPAGSRIGVPCPTQATLRSALRMIELRRPFACDPAATHFGIESSSTLSFASSLSSSATAVDDRDVAVRSQFLLLGETSSVLGAAKVFLEEEPLDITAVSVNLTAEVQSVRSLLVYDDDRRYLGRATLNTASSTNRNYRLTISPGTFQVGKREERTVYFRADVSPYQSGGESGHAVQIANVVVEGNGVWSSRKYTKQSSDPTQFPQFMTARATIESVRNALDASGPLVTGSNQRLASFVFRGRKSDPSAHIDLTDLTFQIEQTGDITLQNVMLKTAGLPDGIPCTVTSSVVTCSGIPDLLGSLADAPRTILLFGDILPSGAARASLRLTLNETGDPQHAGAVVWTDGSVSHSWIATDAPVAQGTYWKY